MVKFCFKTFVFTVFQALLVITEPFTFSRNSDLLYEFQNVFFRCSIIWFVMTPTSVSWLILYSWLGPYLVQLYLEICQTGRKQYFI